MNSERKVMDLKQGLIFLEKGITKLENILEGIPEEQFSIEECVMLYTLIYNMCTQKPQQFDSQARLFDNYKKILREYIKNMVLPVLRGKHDEFLLREFVKRWDNHKIMVQWLSKFFQYLDRYFLARRNLPTLNESGFMCFRDEVYGQVKKDVNGAVVTLIAREREGEQIGRPLVEKVARIFVQFGMGKLDAYESDFERAVLTDAAAYYSIKGASWIQEDSFPDYMLKAEECLRREKERVGQYLHASTERKLLEKVEQELLTKHANQLLENERSGCQALLRNDKAEDLSRMYRLFCRIPKGLESVAAIFKQQLTDEGTTLVKQAEHAARKKKADKNYSKGGQERAFVSKVIELHDTYVQYVNNCFVNDSVFHVALKQAFGVLCNTLVAGSTTAELLATFCENILKKGGNKKLSDEEIEDTFEKVVQLLRYINDKDLFAEFYHKMLARRLLFEKSANEDHERSMLTKLKQQFGRQFTSKMESMLTDLTLAKENQTSFRDYLNNDPTSNRGIDLTVMVLRTGLWPNYKSSDLALPAEMVRCVQVYKEFYQTNTKSRKLTWIHSLGTSTINGNFDSKPIELKVATCQAALLLLFNEAKRLSYADIKQQLNLADEDIVKLLHSLSCAKYKILNKYPSSQTVTPADWFEFNTEFTDKMNRITIPIPSNTEEKKKVIEDVDRDHRHAIDASIVQIMKSRKVLSHQQLVLEYVEQPGKMFKPDIKVIKKRIEDLMEREYLERDKDDPSKLRYLA